MFRTPLVQAMLSLMTALVLVMSAAPVLAYAGDNRSLAQAEPFTWWMESRYELGWRLYDDESHTYPNEYIYPEGWQVGFDACDSPLTAGAAGITYGWHIEGVSSVFSADFEPSEDCRLDLESSPQAPQLPAQGTYIVTLTIGADGSEPVTASQTIQVRDLLIVSLGDSNASGEGNPHVNQAGGLRPVDGIWFESRCHRSANSGHARAAATIEADDPHTAVTYLSFACSGAELWDGLISGYFGIETPSNALTFPLDPQVISVMEALCQSDISNGDMSCIDTPREIDSLFLSIGINDIGFSAILINCMFEEKIQDIDAGDVWIPGIVDGLVGQDWDQIKENPVDYLLGPLDEILSHAFDLITNFFGKDWLACGEDLDPFFDMNLAALWSHYALLGEVLAGESIQVASDIEGNQWDHHWMSPSLRRDFVDRYGSLSPGMAQSIVPKAVYVTSYPVDPFTDEDGFHGGCGVFEPINMNEAIWFNGLGVRLNRFLEWQTEKHRWHFVDGVTKGFEGHGYCAGDESYYVSLAGSFSNQGNHKGTIHPNSNGHNVTRDMLLDTYYGEKPDWSVKHGVTFDVEAVRITDTRENPQSSATFTAKINDRWYRHEHTIAQVNVPVGEWHTLPENQFRFQTKLADDEIITVLGHTSLGAGIFYPPKCYDFECAEAIPPTLLKTEREYSLANGWGRDYPWCETGPRINFFTTNRTCTVEVTSADFKLEMRMRITIINLSQAPPGSIFEPGDQVACGNHCDGPAVVVASSLDEYIDYLEAIGEDATAIAILANFIEEQLALG